MIDAHRLAEERSLAYHRVVAERLEREPELLERARGRVRESLARGIAPTYAREWARILALPVEDIQRALVDESERGVARRQATPFAGAISPRERWRLWREVRARLESRP